MDSGTAAASALALTPAQRLWSKAYDRAKEKEPKLFDSYERILSLGSQQDELHSDVSCISNAIDQTNPTLQWRQMEQLARKRLDRLEKEDKFKQAMSKGLHAILSIKDLVSAALQSVPQAAPVWAGVCFILQVRAVLP